MGTAKSPIYYKVMDGVSVVEDIAVGTATSATGNFIDNTTETVAKTLFNNTSKGTANIVTRFNFDRDKDTANNPFVINLNAINVADKTTPIIVNTNNPIVNENATFVYGRVAGPNRAPTKNCTGASAGVACQTDSVPSENPSIIFQIYLDTTAPGAPAQASIPALNNSSRDGIQDGRWRSSQFHDAETLPSDGVIKTIGTNITQHARWQDTLVTQPAAPIRVVEAPIAMPLVKVNGAFYRSILRYDGGVVGDDYPYEAEMKHTPSEWLIYDETNNAATFNKFKIKFSNLGSWSGEHEGNATTETKAAVKTNRRILW